MFASASNKGDCFEEIMFEPPATIKGDSEFLSPHQNLEEIILGLNGYKEKVLSKMDDWTNGSTSTFPIRILSTLFFYFELL